MTEEYVEPGANGHEELTYDEFVKGLEDKGVIKTADQVSGMKLLEATQEQRAAAVHYIASAGKADAVFAKEGEFSKLLAGISDQIARTIFSSHEQFTAYLELVDWCLEFEYMEGLVFCYQYAIALPSIGGVSRHQLVDTVTTQRLYGGQFNGSKRRGIQLGRGRQPEDIQLS